MCSRWYDAASDNSFHLRVLSVESGARIQVESGILVLGPRTYISISDALKSSLPGDTICLCVGHHWESGLVPSSPVRLISGSFNFNFNLKLLCRIPLHFFSFLCILFSLYSLFLPLCPYHVTEREGLYMIRDHVTLHHVTLHHVTLHHITSRHITSRHITSRHITSRHITLHHITSRHITSRHITLHHITSRHITSRHITSRHITSRHITSRHITSHYITSHYIASYYITSHHVTLHHVTLHRVILHHVTFYHSTHS